ncbi:MAG: efflux RND transporter periplasmic adaptor subunit [Comamonadaceae bacterium]|nr:MAG: efflux RND transporter periplasmic adaptor subunit [Comamonadaceae bacterium]
MAKKLVHTVVAVVGIAALSGAAWWYQNRPKPLAVPGETTATAGQGAAGAARPASGAGGGVPGVEAGLVQVTKLTDDTQAVGSLRSRQSVVLRPEVSGRITQLNFRDGDRVRKGQLLVQFDDQLPLAQVQQSQAELSIAQANHKRNQELVGQGFISQRSVDESSANLEVAQAKLSLSRATAQRLKIIAPFDGIAGIRTVNVGDYLKDGADVVNVEDIDAVFVDFRLPERFQSKVRRGQQATVELDALPGRKFTAFIQAVDPLIDANGRSVGVRGCIDNRQLQLRPGMFARVNAVFGQRDNALVVPEEAIVPQGNRQFVIKLIDGADPKIKTTQRVEVKVGIRRPGRVEIVEGLQEGDRVVTAGQQRVQKDGSSVRVMDVAGGGGGAASGAGAAAGPAAGPAAAATPAQAPVATAPAAPAAMTVRAAPSPAAGPNPCLVGMADMPRPAAAPGARRAPTESVAPKAMPAGRDPA